MPKPITENKKSATPTPPPFLGPIFEKNITPVIATGFNYQADEIAMHGVKNHGAIDFDVPRGTTILAPADGYYVATYGEYLTRLEDGSPRTMSLTDAIERSGRRRQNIRPPDKSNGPWSVYYGSYVIQGWHGKGRYTQFAHVEWANESIPYYPPTHVEDGDKKKTGDLAHNQIMQATVTEYRQGAAKFLKAGSVIGVVGSAGCGWGRRAYDDAKFAKDGRPDFRNGKYTYWCEPHLHFMVFGQRRPRSRKPSYLWDPFGIYGQIDAGYPAELRQWHTLPHSLWLKQD